ncbi:S1 family peptidase [Caballeronia sordidicola]|uniref:S1 family peptidase n=1 Tax=Caballeronia sordidicola TaxID=196367 RepID=UPI00094E3D34|nr:serine protease [Caballeronia sordidicola]
MKRSAPKILALLFVGLNSYSNAQDTQCIFANDGPATAYIDLKFSTESDGNGGDTGSGFIVSPSGYVITSAHVVKPKTDGAKVISSSITVRVGGLSSSPVPATISAEDIDESADIALIKLAPATPKENWPFLPISYVDKLSVGSRLTGLGFASGADLAIVPPGEKTSDSTIVDGKEKAWWTTSLALSHGNSGGPIFGQLGTVVGIAVAINRNSSYLTYVIPIAQAQSLLSKANVQPQPFGPCADFPLCRHPSHGVEGYRVDEVKEKESELRPGGGNPKANQDSWCADYLGELQKLYPNSSFTKVASRDGRLEWDNELLRIGAKYTYFCSYRRLEDPIYKEQKTAACLK